MQLKWNNRIFIIGTSRTGKSYLRDWIIGRYIRNNNRRYYCIIDDRLDNVMDLKNKYGFKIIEVNKDNINKNINFKKIMQTYEKVAFITTNVLQSELKSWLNKISYTMWDLGDGLLVIDEAWAYLKRGKHDPEEFKRVVRGGAKQGLDTIVVTHRIQDIDPDLIALFNIFISFRIDEPNSIDKVVNYFDQFNNPDKSLIDNTVKNKSKRKLNQLVNSYSKPEQIIKNLPNYHFLYADRVNSIQEITSSLGI